MCGRFTLTSSDDIVAELFELAGPIDLSPRYNIAPTQDVAIVRNGGAPDEPTAPCLSRVRWGLIPFWAKDPAIGNRLINARAETVAEKPSFRAALRKRRCLVIADGFYEWKKSGGAKIPHLIRMRGGAPFGFAGLWESWKDPGGEVVESCTIITTTPNQLMSGIHNRMPVILPPELRARWLDPAPLGADAAGTLAEVLGPLPDGQLEAVAVSTHVNSPRNDDPRCVEPA